MRGALSAGGEPAAAGSLEILVAARSARALVVHPGQRLEIVDLEGQQVADLVGFRHQDPTEWLSPSHTRGSLQSLRLRVGGTLVSNRRQPLLRVLQDDVGVHDLLFAMCDEARYRVDYGISEHANCRDNLAQALSGWGVASWQLPDPVNVFQNSPVDAQGGISSAEPRSRAGDKLVLEVMADLVLGVSACAQDQNPCNGWNPSPILMRLHPAG
ncbi:MAG: DUF1989 domain-containing protein [Candidatus Dormibacteria bacterium]